MRLRPGIPSPGPVRQEAPANSKAAQNLIAIAFFAAFTAVIIKASFYAANAPSFTMLNASIQSFGRSRPDIVDRHGRILATDIRAYWLYANPQQLVNADDAAESAASLFRDLDAGALARKLGDKTSRFEWIKRGMTPRQAEAAYKLGVPGFYIVPAPQRVYPAGSTAAQILGLTNVDNTGISGIEKYIEDNLTEQLAQESFSERPVVKLSLDLGVQHVVGEELAKASVKFATVSAMALLLDVRSGEVLASVSLPDFDPNRRDEASSQNRQNRLLSDAYELGSVFKAFTVAMAMDEAHVRASDRVGVTPLQSGRFTLRDHHAKTATMTVEDIFAHSSNTGAARLALMVGGERQRLFLKKFGLFNRVETEAGLSAQGIVPPVWRQSTAITAAYGHGITVSPLLFASAAATLVNGGRTIKPTFVLSSGGKSDLGEQVITAETSAAIRRLMQITVQRGTGRRASVTGVSIGGKTGTAWKAKEGFYTRDVINTFVAAFPIEQPRYLLMVTLDEPKAEPGNPSNEASQNAAPVAGAIIARVATMLDILPTARFDEASASFYEQP